jgi:hypothetical protein
MKCWVCRRLIMPETADDETRRRGISASGPSVWTGRALQAENDDLEMIGLALLYPAPERNVVFQAIMDNPRALDLIRDSAPKAVRAT